jgi:cell division protein ZapA (FtsZ GTPase activity inhibitor)
MEEQISIKINLGDRLYPIKINATDEEQVRNAVKLINDKEKQYRNQFALKDKQDALAMTALEFANELQDKSKPMVNNDLIIERLKKLDSLLTQLTS